MTAHPAIRLLHDVGAATWFGGSLMGATGLNGATAQLDNPAERARVSTAGWSRWAPVGTAAVVAHLVGAAGLTVTDFPRIVAQRGVARSSAVKALVTLAGVGVNAWSVGLNRKMADAGAVPVAGATEPAWSTPPDVSATQRQLAVAQWLNPLLAGGVIGTAAWQSQQQRTTQVVAGVVRRVGGVAGVALAAAAGVGAAAAVSRGRSSGRHAVDPYPVPPVVQHPQPGNGVPDLSVPHVPAGAEPDAPTAT